jgi:hypothetical protein
VTEKQWPLAQAGGFFLFQKNKSRQLFSLTADG